MFSRLHREGPRRTGARAGADGPRPLLVFVALALLAGVTTLIPRTDAAGPAASPSAGALSAAAPAAPLAPPAPETATFQGSYTDAPAARACGPRHSFQVAAGKQRIVITAAATVTTNDILVNLYGPSGELLTSGDSGTSPEPVAYLPQGGVPPGTYQVEVCPYDEPAVPPQAPYSYAGTFTADDTAVPTATPAPSPGPTASPTPGPSSVPRYHNYSPPKSIGETAAEPSIGFNPFTKRAMYISGLQTLRVTFPEEIEPKGSIPEAGPARWDDVSFISTKTRSLDPILFTDQRTGRTFVSQLNSVAAAVLLLPGNSLMAYSDDDGASWTPAQLNLPDGSNDHQTVGAGPYPASVPLGNDINKGSAVYYCGQAGNVLVATSVALCSRSDNGGLTFNRPVPVYPGSPLPGGCSQLIHGHVKVAPDGTVYLPNAQCGGRQAVAVSTDAGTTWTLRTIPGSFTPTGILDPSVGISNDPPTGPGATSNTIYVGYTGRPAAGAGENHPYAVVSRDRGLTWSTPIDLGASHGIRNAVFAQTVAGDHDRAAVAFLGTTTGGDHQAASFKGTWYGYVAHTYDGGKTWTTVRVTPDPVQREACIWNGGGNNPCRNLLDFNDATMDDRGRVLFAYADGCVDECAKGGANTYSAKATIARQSGGKGLLKRFDTPEPALPRRAYLSGRRDDMAAYLSWAPPDNGGSPVTAYKIYRGTSPGNEVFIGTAAGDATSYNDRSGDVAVASYTYKVRAVNALGEGPASNVVTLAVGPRLEATGACELPGVTAVQDPAGDPSDGQPFHDITSVSLAEPQDMPGKLVFTIKVANLSTIPPGWRWAARFSAPQRPPNAVWGATEDWFVSMVTSDGLAPTFTYGTTGVPTVNNSTTTRVFTTLGNLDPASKATADGTITLVLPKSVIGNPQPGQAISGILGSVRATVPSALPGTGGTNETIPDSTGGGGYTLRPSTLCLPNAAPLARLTADVDEGVKPLAVRFDAGASSDADSIDTIATYTFNFGDGSDDVVSNSPVISHTFDLVGEYPVRLVVTDSRGKVSANTAQYLVKVRRDPACSTNVAAAANGATAAASSTYPNGNYAAAGAIDGDRTGANWGAGGGWSDGTRDAYPDTLEVTFDGPKKIDEIRVFTLPDDFQNPQEPTATTTSLFYGLLDYDVQYWDGSQWVPVPGGEVRFNNKVRRSFAFADITTTKIRVVAHNARNFYSRVVEVEAFGCPAQ